MADYPEIISPDMSLTVDQIDNLTPDQISQLSPTQSAQFLTRMGHKRALNRRRFLGGLAASGVAVAGAGLLAGCGDSKKAIAAGPSEADVLNFALNLEYLEANFYLFATTGVGLPAADQGASPGAVTGGVKTVFTDPEVAAIAADITGDEQKHVELLRTALAANAVVQPAIKLDALGSFATQAGFLTVARAFEDTGVSAYAGAATLLTGNNLATAAKLLATEAYHASGVRLKVIDTGISSTQPKLDSLDVPPASPNAFFTVDASGLAIARTPSQVLMIVYATTSTGVSAGGFFPNGVNGTIKTT